MLWAERSMKTFLEELINHKAWECKHAEFKITYVQFVSLQSSLIKLGNELQQRMQDRRLRGHEHRHKINNEIRTLWCKNKKKKSFPTVLAHGPKKRLKMLIKELTFWTFRLDHKEVPTFTVPPWMWLTEWWREKLRVLTFTHWKFRTLYKLLAEAIAIIQTLISLCEW